MTSKSRIIIALDYAQQKLADELIEQLDPKVCRLKVGKEMFTTLGPKFVESLVAKGFDVFLDLKFHDIPNTVARACSAACDLGVWMLNVHASGGRQMMEAAKESIDKSSHQPLLIAVTILTSLDDAALHEIGYIGSSADNVLRLAKLTQSSGLDGIVCSAQEASQLRSSLGDDFVLVTPGIRLAGGDAGDQRRVMTPADAISAGASYLVMGRPITQAENPMSVLNSAEKEIG